MPRLVQWYFQYQSMQSLEIVDKEMSSSAGDKLRNDELKFMNVAKNYHVLTQSDQLTKNKFKKNFLLLKMMKI